MLFALLALCAAVAVFCVALFVFAGDSVAGELRRRFATPKREVSVLLLGLDNSGKTTLRMRLVTGRIAAAAPTTQPTGDLYERPGVNMYLHDLGGHAQARAVWKDYFAKIAAVVFVIDASDGERISEALEELKNVASTLATQSTPPMVVLLNKDDLVYASRDRESADLFLDALAENANEQLPVGMQRTVVRSSITEQRGYTAAFDWLERTVETPTASPNLPEAAPAPEVKRA